MINGQNGKKILNIYGEKFSGKTHLSNIFKSKTNALFIKANKFDDEIFKKIKLYENIVIDDFEKNMMRKLLIQFLI